MSNGLRLLSVVCVGLVSVAIAACGDGGSGTGGAGGAGASSTGGSTPGSGGTSVTSSGAGGSCEDEMGSPSCDGVNLNCDSYCQSALTNLKPHVAELAIACIAADPNPGASFCSGAKVCIIDALADGDACAGDAADQACASAKMSCSPVIDDAGCHDFLDGLTAGALSTVAGCVDAGCMGGLETCVRATLGIQ